MLNSNKISLVYFLFLIFLWSCSHKIEIVKFDGKTIIQEGDTAEICWEFKKADYVVVEGIKNEFKRNDCVKIFAKESKTINIKAISYFDTLNLKWDLQTKGRTRTGLFDFKHFETSFDRSDYFKGIDNLSENKISQIKVLSYYADDYNINVEFILLDEFGNFITDFEKDNLEITSSFDSYEISEIQSSSEENRDKLNIAFFIDNSFSSENLEKCLNKLFNVFNLYSKYFNIDIIFYNSAFSKLIKPPIDIEDFSLQEKGLNNLYFTTYDYLDNFEDDENSKNIIINIAFSGDNSSIFVDAKDVASLAKSKNFKIYNIISGSAANTHSFLYMSNFTGGRLYFCENDNCNELTDIINEIILSQVYNHKVTFSELVKDSLTFTISYFDGEFEHSDNFKLYSIPEEQYSDYQIIALFNHKSIEVNELYLKNINLLADVAKQNPKYILELIGYAEIEGKEEQTKILAYNRAKRIYEILVELGVSPAQIRIVSEGSSKPIYYLATKPWQKLYNRRVEIRWIHPDDLPFEIITSSHPSETAAQSTVNIWKSRGYKAYYERYLKNNSPYYRVKLWGYASKEEAQKVISNLKKKYKGNYELR